MKIRRGISAVFMVGVAMFGLTGCADYSRGQVVEAEDDMGEDGPVKELEVVRTAMTNTMSEPDTYEVHVDENSPCDVGSIYPECDDQDKNGEADSSQDDD